MINACINRGRAILDLGTRGGGVELRSFGGGVPGGVLGVSDSTLCVADAVLGVPGAAGATTVSVLLGPAASVSTSLGILCTGEDTRETGSPNDSSSTSAGTSAAGSMKVELRGFSEVEGDINGDAANSKGELPGTMVDAVSRRGR